MKVRHTLLLATTAFLAGRPDPVAAQQQANVAGIIIDAATSRPLFGATVVLSSPASSRVVRTDQSGAFVFARVANGTYTLLARQMGYAPHTETVVISQDTQLSLKLDRLAALDTFRVRSARQAIYGVVAAATDYRPLSNSSIQILGPSAGRVVTDSAGRFFYPVQSAGVYVVRAKADGFVTQSVSVTVEKANGVDVALVLDDDGGQPNHTIEAAFFDFQARLSRRGNASALVPRSELMPKADAGMVAALLATPLFSSKGLRFSNDACVFVDGTPRAGMSMNSIDIREVEAVEVYSASSERSRTLEDRWPRQWRCGDTGMPRVNQGMGGSRTAAAEIVRWIVVWTKR